MKDDFENSALLGLIASLSPQERQIYKAFIEARASPHNTALIVFHTGDGIVMCVTTTPLHDMDTHIEQLMRENGDIYKTLLMTLNTQKKFADQWPRRNNDEKGWDYFIAASLIDTPELPEKTGARLYMAHTTNAPQQPSQKPAPHLRIIQGGRQP